MLDRSRARRNLPALGAAALAFAAGCTGSSAPPEGAATGCLGGRAKPLSGEVVIAALRERGFSARAMTTSDLCRALDASLPEGDRAAFHVTNEESGSWAEVREREGIASCVVRKGPIRGPTLRSEVPGGESPGAQVARLRRAMMRLETTA